jgi:hypothetical protein
VFVGTVESQNADGTFKVVYHDKDEQTGGYDGDDALDLANLHPSKNTEIISANGYQHGLFEWSVQ